MTVGALSRGSNPFDASGTHRRADGICVYEGLPETLVHELLDVAARTPDVEAVVEIGGDRLTYAELLDRASRVAGGLLAGGLVQGDRVALRLPAGTDWVVAFWGVLLARGIVVAVNTRFAAPEIEFVLADSGASVDLTPGTALPDGEPHIDSAASAQEIAAIFYTSGTTGRPKGVPTTHLAFLSNSETMVRCMGIDREIGAGLRTLISVPLFHVTGCNAQLLTALHVGGTSVVLPALDLSVMMATIIDERISFLVTVPAIYNLMLRQPAPACVRQSRCQQCASRRLRRCPDRVVTGALAAVGVPLCSGLQRIRRHRDLLDRQRAAGCGGCRARRQHRLPGPCGRYRDRSAWWGSR